MFIGKFWQFTDSNKSEKVLFNLLLLPNIHPWCGRGHPGPGPQPGCISQHLALDRSRRDTAELPAKDTSERSQQLRCQDPRLPRHQVVSRHGNSHHVVLVWSVNSEIVNLMLDIQSQSINSRKMSVIWCSVECYVWFVGTALCSDCSGHCVRILEQTFPSSFRPVRAASDCCEPSLHDLALFLLPVSYWMIQFYSQSKLSSAHNSQYSHRIKVHFLRFLESEFIRWGRFQRSLCICSSEKFKF